MSQEKLFKLRDMTREDVTHLLTVLLAVVVICAFPIAYILLSDTGEKQDFSLVRAGPTLNLTATVTTNPPSTIGLLSVADTKVREYYRISIREDEDRSAFLPVLGKEVYNDTLTQAPLRFTWTLNPCVETWVDITTNDGYFTQSFKPTAVCG
jgi:hypothetical protein